MLKLGLVVGQGTGPEVAAVFEQSVSAIAARHALDVEILRCPHRFRTYSGLLAGGVEPAEVDRLATEDAERYEAFLTSLHASGVRHVFRTAINAQPLYLVRERLQAIKVERLVTPSGELLLVRDETQGFYAGVNDRPGPGTDAVVRRSCEFRRDATRLVLDHARRLADQAWGPGRVDQLVMAYKFHLLDTRFARWVDEYAAEHGLEIRLYQPDTANRQLSRDLLRGKVLFIGANEWADIMHAELILKYGQGAQEERFSENVYLHPRAAGLIEYQTVHGSADDIGGRGIVNPSATLRAAAHLLEHHGGCDGAVDTLEAALRECEWGGQVTPDRGGTATTDAMVRRVLAAYGGSGDRPAASSARGRQVQAAQALLVVDLQNDFAAPGGAFDRRGLIDPGATRILADTAALLVKRARAAGVTVAFARTLYDDERLSPAQRARNRTEGRHDCVQPRSWGAEFFGVQPLPGEIVTTKNGYDPFLGTTLEQELRGRGVGRLLVTGLFSDVCVDAAARTACQLGFEVAIVRDGTLALERTQESCLSFMSRFYGAQSLGSDELLDGWRPETAGPESAGAAAEDGRAAAAGA